MAAGGGQDPAWILPEIIPVFPLPGVLLLPGGRLPLNIFEPRYVAMIDDALGAPPRAIGMIQPLDAERGQTAPGLYPIGCLGRITSFAEHDSGRYRYLITLTGMCRFTIREEMAEQRGYRRMRVDYDPWRGDRDTQGGVTGVDRSVKGTVHIIDREQCQLRVLGAHVTVCDAVTKGLFECFALIFGQRLSIDGNILGNRRRKRRIRRNFKPKRLRRAQVHAWVKRAHGRKALVLAIARPCVHKR
jgi:Lon protease-like protein